MLPLAHLERRLTEHRKKKTHYHLTALVGLFLFLSIASLIAPLIHELMHLFILDANHTPYMAQMKFDWANGLTGKITPLSEMGFFESLTLLGIGVFSNLILGLAFFAGAGWASGVIRMLFVYAGAGFLYNPVTYFFAAEGDIIGIMQIAELQAYTYILPAIGLTFALLAAYYVHEHSKEIIEEYRLLAEEIEEFEVFFGLRAAPGTLRS